MTLCTALVLSFAVQSPQATAGPQPQPAPKVLQINGAKNPEMIPEYLVWTSDLRYIAGGKDRPPSSLTSLQHELHLSDTDFASLTEVAGQAEAMNAEASKKTLHEFAGLQVKQAAMPAVQEKVHTIELQRRRDLLDLVDKLLERLSPDGRISLTNWVADSKSTISVTVLQKDLEFFRLPR